MNRCSKKVQQIYRRTPMPKCDFSKVVSNFTEIALQHGCLPVNLPHISRTPFSRNTSGRLLLMIISGNEKRSNSSIRNVFILVWCQTCDLCSERAHNISQFIKIGAVFFVASHGKFKSGEILQIESDLSALKRALQIGVIIRNRL